MRHDLDVMREAGAAAAGPKAADVGARGDLWPQIVSDVTGLPQARLAGHAGAACGDALLAAIAVGAAGLDTDWAAVETGFSPDAAAAPLYDELYRLYRELYPATRNQAHALAALQRQASAPDEDEEVGRRR